MNSQQIAKNETIVWYWKVVKHNNITILKDIKVFTFLINSISFSFLNNKESIFFGFNLHHTIAIKTTVMVYIIYKHKNKWKEVSLLLKIEISFPGVLVLLSDMHTNDNSFTMSTHIWIGWICVSVLAIMQREFLNILSVPIFSFC